MADIAKSFGLIKLIDNNTVFKIEYNGTVCLVIDKATQAVTVGEVASTGAGNLFANDVGVQGLLSVDGNTTAGNITCSSQEINGHVIFNGGADTYLQLPSLTGTQRDALTPANGMLIYNTTANEMQGYINGSWTSVAAG